MHPSALLLRAQEALGRAVLKLPRPALVALSGGRRVRLDGCVLDEQLQLMLHLSARLGRATTPRKVSTARRVMDHDAHVFAPDPPEMRRVFDEGLREGLTVRVYEPHGLSKPAPALVYIHGGGYVIGSLDSHDTLCRCLARDARCVVVSVGYRLAPEHPFPAAPDDCAVAFRWAVRECDRLGVDPARIAVGGESAGGCLAAVVALDTRDDKHPPCLQALLYPGTDFTMSFPSCEVMAKGFLLEGPTIEWFRAQYVPDASQWKHPRASPLYAKSLEGLPPALVQTAGFDPLRDEGEAYVKRLREAGVMTEHKRYPSLVHGYLNLTGTIAAAREPYDDLVTALRRASG